jgi:hypothetical protein
LAFHGGREEQKKKKKKKTKIKTSGYSFTAFQTTALPRIMKAARK